MTDQTSPTAAFHTLMGRLPYPMFILTAAAGDDRSGCLVGFTTQVSIDPDRFLICVSQTNHTFGVVAQTDYVGVHFPPAEDRRLASLFGSETGDELDKFELVAWEEGPHGVPLLADLADRFVGHVIERVDFGDHVGLLLDPVHVDVGPDRPYLTFPQVEPVEPGHDP